MELGPSSKTIFCVSEFNLWRRQSRCPRENENGWGVRWGCGKETKLFGDEITKNRKEKKLIKAGDMLHLDNGLDPKVLYSRASFFV